MSWVKSVPESKIEVASPKPARSMSAADRGENSKLATMLTVKTVVISVRFMACFP
jgi:hypothetical protein